MKFKLSFLLFSILPFLTILGNPKVFWAFHILILLVISLEKKAFVNRSGFNSYLFLLGLPLIWTIFFSFDDNYILIVKALFYLTTPLIFTYIGIRIAQLASQKMIFNYLIYYGTTSALLYILFSIYNFGLFVFLDPMKVREILLWSSISNVIAIVIILFSDKYGINLLKNRYHKLVLTAINLSAIYLSASRTYYVILIMFLIIFLYHKNKKILAVFGVFLFLVLNIYVTYNNNSIFAEKLKSGITETFVGNYNSEDDITHKYRGYETYRALKTYTSGGLINLLFGHGCGKLVDLGTYVELGSADWKLIPIIHNGFVYQLLRQGALSLILFLIFFAKVFKINHTVSNFYFRIILGSILSLIISNYVISSFFSVEMLLLWMLIGAYIVHADRANKRYKIIKNEVRK